VGEAIRSERTGGTSPEKTMNQDESIQLTKVVTIVEDMHHRLFGNGQPGFVKETEGKIANLEADRNKVLGVAKFVKFMAALTPLIVVLAEGYRLWLATQPVTVQYLP
jgi:hypothetical protein